MPAGEPWESLSQGPRTVTPAPSLGLVPPCTFLSLGRGHTGQCSGLTTPVSVLRGLNLDRPHRRQAPFPLCSLPAPPLLLQPLSGLPCWDWGGGSCCWGLWLPQEHPLQPILGHAGKGPTPRDTVDLDSDSLYASAPHPKIGDTPGFELRPDPSGLLGSWPGQGVHRGYSVSPESYDFGERSSVPKTHVPTTVFVARPTLPLYPLALLLLTTSDALKTPVEWVWGLQLTRGAPGAPPCPEGIH